ncbi:MAG: RlpA-like double-psi beta-barrel-protein domain-containing protein-containing protein [Benjaminiella poitrasii]|nr:MAG: RlpA-like double-psi beta-barrel-protein domain-containing protein-containing protein [Benjaminiella poitrasii]
MATHAELPNSSIHPFGAMQDNTSQMTERDPLIVPPPTIWARFNSKYRFGKQILVASGAMAIFVVMFIVLGTLGVFKNKRYRNEIGISSIGKTKYPGHSSGSWESNTKEGEGDGTYYDPGVGLTACGTTFTAEDYIVAMNAYDFGESANPNESPVCGACIIVTGPNGSQKAQVQDICPASGCGRGSVDMTPAVFNKIGDINAGRIPVSWKQC